MSTSDLKTSEDFWDVREDLSHIQKTSWQCIARPGTWWTGRERVAIAAETRQAMSCKLCRNRKAALSPYDTNGSHNHLRQLPDPAIEAIHRIRTDAGRLKESWYQGLLALGLSDAHYVELVAVVSAVAALDTFNRGMGRPLQELPKPVEGTPSRRRPAGARRTIAWMPTLQPEDIAVEDYNPYSDEYEPFNIHMALSLVPEEAEAFRHLDEANYLPQMAIRDLDTEYRAITHVQMELLAARVSSLNQCFY